MDLFQSYIHVICHRVNTIVGLTCSFSLKMLRNKLDLLLVPIKHTTSFWRWYNVVSTSTTLLKRRNNVACLLTFRFLIMTILLWFYDYNFCISNHLHIGILSASSLVVWGTKITPPFRLAYSYSLGWVGFLFIVMVMAACSFDEIQRRNRSASVEGEARKQLFVWTRSRACVVRGSCLVHAWCVRGACVRACVGGACV